MKLAPLLLGAVLGSALLSVSASAKIVDEHCDDPIYEQYDLDVCKDIDPSQLKGDRYTS